MAEIAALPAQAYVYVIGAPDGPIKIGVAADAAARCAMLQVGNPAALTVLHKVSVSRRDVYFVERYAHALLSDDRIRGEWFDVEPDQAIAAVNASVEALRSGAAIPPEPKPISDSWQRRAKDAGLSQVTLARLLGRPVNTISRQIRGEHGDVPQHLVAVIIAWEMMTSEQREDWMAATREACGLD